MARLIIAIAVAAVVTIDGAEPTVRRLDGSTIMAAEIDRTVQRLMQAARVPGLALAILNNRKVVYLKAYGERDVEKHLPLTRDSVMNAASYTKSTFAYAVMQLVEEGVLSLDRPVQDYLPKPLPEYADYTDLAGDERYRQITLRMLLSHTVGFHNLRILNKGRITLNFDPGSRYAYSGEGIRLMQFLVETVTQQPMQELMRERVYRRFRMQRTSMTWEPRFESDYANGYNENGRSLGPQRRTRADAAGSMQTTLADFARFITGVAQGQGLKRETRTAMLSPQIRIHTRRQFPSLNTELTDRNDAIRLSYGLGWGLFWTPVGQAFFKEATTMAGSITPWSSTIAESAW
jgi:CubicO group peptidase (beta-lactamase class C family)